MSSNPDHIIRHILRVKSGDSLPFTGWYKATRRDLARIFAELGYTTGAEIGVRKGTFSAILCEAVPGLQLTCVDPWLAYERVTQNMADSLYARAVETLAPYGVTIIKKTSLEASLIVPDASLDFVYIDAAHDFDNVMVDIVLWSKKVRKGGIVSGHDYFNFYKAGVCWAVDAYTHAHGITNWYLTKEKEASWFWVKT